MKRPETNEYAPFYKGYIDKIVGDDILEVLNNNTKEIKQVFDALTEEKGEHRYAPEKWSLKELFGHIIDAERIFSYRYLRISRNDKTPLPGFDENNYVLNNDLSNRSLQDLLLEFMSVRESTMFLIKNTNEEVSLREGNSNGFGVTVRALAYIIAGHASHHLNIIKERYLI